MAAEPWGGDLWKRIEAATENSNARKLGRQLIIGANTKDESFIINCLEEYVQNAFALHQEYPLSEYFDITDMVAEAVDEEVSKMIREYRWSCIPMYKAKRKPPNQGGAQSKARRTDTPQAYLNQFWRNCTQWLDDKSFEAALEDMLGKHVYGIRKRAPLPRFVIEYLADKKNLDHRYFLEHGGLEYMRAVWYHYQPFAAAEVRSYQTLIKKYPQKTELLNTLELEQKTKLLAMNDAFDQLNALWGIPLNNKQGTTTSPDAEVHTIFESDKDIRVYRRDREGFPSRSTLLHGRYTVGQRPLRAYTEPDFYWATVYAYSRWLYSGKAFDTTPYLPEYIDIPQGSPITVLSENGRAYSYDYWTRVQAHKSRIKRIFDQVGQQERLMPKQFDPTVSPEILKIKLDGDSTERYVIWDDRNDLEIQTQNAQMQRDNFTEIDELLKNSYSRALEDRPVIVISDDRVTTFGAGASVSLRPGHRAWHFHS